MKKEYIMICLEKLGIGGVETAVINQIMAFIQKKYFVVVLSKDGIYRKDIEKIGAKFIEFDFEITNEFELIKSEKIKKLLVELNITQVHVHQFPCLNYIIPVCINMNIPYVLYIHVGILNNSNNVYNWFCENYPIYNFTFLYSFEFAYKIIAITESAKEYIVNRFNFDEKKCLVIPNCINFNNYISQKKVKTINNILIISRFSSEKTKLILNAIDLFFELKKITNNNKLSLTICGDGHEKNKIKQYINDNYKIAVNFIGETKNVFEVIDKNDCVISTDRCILEAMATKKIAVISTYDGLKGVIDKSNIKNVSISNFSANNLPNLNVNEVAKQISFLDESGINNIIESNYLYIKNKFNIFDNIYNIDTLDFKNKINYDSLFLKINELPKLDNKCKYLLKEVENNNNIINNLNKDISKLINEKNNLEKQINDLLIDKSWSEKDLNDVKKHKLLYNNIKFLNKIEKIINQK